MAAPKKKGLGRGLEALFEEISVEIPEEKETVKEDKKTDKTEAENGVLYVDINDIKPKVH